jgi:hypothetical protein
MTPRLLTSADDARRTAFLDALGHRDPGVLAYHHPFYRDALTAAGVGEPLDFALEEHGELTALLPGRVRHAEAGTVFASLPFFGPNAGVLTRWDAGAPARHLALLDAVRAWMRAQPRPLAASLQTPFLQPDFTPYDAAWPEALRVERFTQWCDLQAGEWPAKVRYDLRRAAALGVAVDRDLSPADHDALYALYLENARAVGIPGKPRAVLDALARAPRERVRHYAARHAGRLVAGLIVLRSAATVSYYLPCNRDDARALQPGMALIDAAAREARADGLRWWNWEGSPGRESGVYRFKQRWGAVESPYRTYVLPFQPPEAFAALGRDRLSADFPFFFVYPFDRLPPAATTL